MMSPPASTSATINVTINTFNPIGSIYPIDATLALAPGTPSQFSLVDGLLTVAVPNGTPVTLNYVLNDANNVLIGIALKPDGAGAGRNEFPSIAASRTPAQSTLAVTDLSKPEYQNTKFTYVIVVQQVTTGYLGIIDPDIENEPA